MTKLFGTVWRTTVILIAFLIAADIAGVLICTLFDITPLRWKSALLPYAIWLVLGVFTGLFAYGIAGAWSAPLPEEGKVWTDNPAAQPIGRYVVLTSAAVIAGLIWLFNDLYWSKGVNGEFFVPDSAPHSLTFFLSVLAAIAGTHMVLRPQPQGLA